MTGESTYTSHAGGWLPRPVAILLGARAVNQLAAYSVPFLAVLLVQRHHLSLSGAGVVVAVFGVATIPSRLLGARLTRRLGARTTIVLGLVGCAVAQLGIALAPGRVAVLAAVALLGLAYEVYEPPSQSLVAELTDPAHRARAFSSFGAALALGGVVGGVLAAVLGGLDLRWLFVADAASCLTCAAVVRLGLPDHRVAAAPGTPSARPWRDRRLRVMLAMGTGFATLYLQLRIALPLTLVARGLPASRFGLVLAVASLVVVAAQPLLGTQMVRRWLGESFRAMTVGYLLLAAGLAATGLAAGLIGFLMATVVWSLGDVLLLGHPFAVVADLAPAGASAAYLAVFGTCWGVAGVLAPVVGTVVLQVAGPRTLWLGCALAALVLAALQPSVRRLMASPGPASG